MGYVLQTNSQSQQRLSIQHELYEKASQQFLLQSGLISGMRILEVGCGPGLLTPWLAKLVTTTGQITAIDTDAGYVEITQELCKELPNVTVLHKNLFSLQSISRYDLIYCRLVLHHLSNPEHAIRLMINALDHRGILVCEEVPTLDGVFVYPQSPAFEKMRSCIIECFKQHGADFQIAYRIATILKQQKLGQIHQQLFQPLAIAQKYRLLHCMGLQDISTKILEYDLLSANELNELIEKMKIELSEADSVSLYRMFQVSGVKT